VRLVHLVPSLDLGGTERVAELLDALASRHGHRSSVDLPFDRSLPAPRSLPLHRWLRWSLRTRSADVFHAHLAWPDRLGAALLAARGRPLVITFHLLPREGAAWPRDRVTGLDARSMIRLAAVRARTVWVALSHHDAARLGELGLRARVIRNAPPPPRPATRPFDWPDGALPVASVGRLDPQKGFDRMLRALAHPTLSERPWHWAIAGDGPALAELTALRDALGLRDRVSFAGSRPPMDLFTGASWVLAPSRSEGMPLVPLEAMEAGVPVLASDIGAHRELFSAAPGSLLPADEARWPDGLGALFDEGTRAAVKLAQRAVLGDDPREGYWRETRLCYDAART
jgi:glycosyltransferase involved in cell wall biosynthesis